MRSSIPSNSSSLVTFIRRIASTTRLTLPTFESLKPNPAWPFVLFIVAAISLTTLPTRFRASSIAARVASSMLACSLAAYSARTSATWGAASSSTIDSPETGSGSRS